jgi:hypothetical protein
VARPSLRVVRTPKARRRAALTAAANPLIAASAPVENASDIFRGATTLKGGPKQWQDEAWMLYDCVGELGFYIRWRARSCSRVKIIASEIDPDTGQPTGSLTTDDDGNVTGEAAEVADIVRSIAGGPLGQAELVERAVQILGVPGEAYIVILVTDDGERWLAITKDEIKRSKKVFDGVAIDLPEGGQHEYTPGNGDGMFRVWNPHARRAAEPDSPVRSNLDPLREIVRTTQKIANADRSRLANNGLLMIPQEASLPTAEAPVSADKPGEDDDVSATQHRQRLARTLQKQIIDANDAGLKDPYSHAAITPMVGTAPGEHIDKIRHITFGKDISDTEIRKRNDAIGRFAMGVDMQPDQLLGLGNVNHWNGYLLTDQDVSMQVKPVMRTLLGGIYKNVIRPMLLKRGIDPDKYVLWFDASDITADPDKSGEAKDAAELGAMRHAALLRKLGLADEDGYDLTTLEGFQELARDKLAAAEPAVAAQLLRDWMPLLDPSIQSLDFPEPTPTLPPGQDGGEPAEEEPVDGSKPDTEGTDETAIAGGVSMAVELMVTRALELAGKRRIKTYDHDQRARLSSRPAHEWHRSLPAVPDADVLGLIKGWDTGLDELAQRYGLDVNQVRSVVVMQARKRLTSQVVDA